MLYCGVYLHVESFEITVLTEGFGFFGKKYFKNQEYDSMFQWVRSKQINDDEHSFWFFDKSNFDDKNKCPLIFCFEDDIHKIYMVDNRKIVNMIQFLGELSVKDSSFFMAYDIDISYILASSVRLFDFEVMSPLLLSEF